MPEDTPDIGKAFKSTDLIRRSLDREVFTKINSNNKSSKF